jgi:iron complex transport system ATP-binding protein
VTALLALRDVHAARGGKPVLAGVTAEVASGELVGLLGPNGAGKTTLMRAALGLGPVLSGEMHLSGVPLAALPREERARRAAYIPQDRGIAWPVTVEALVALGRLPHRAGAAEDARAVEAALATMELASLRHRPATRLSGGERARALIARALAQDAPLLVADEPVAGLDPAHAIGLMARFRALAVAGRGVLVSLHDLALAARWCHRILLLDRGRLVADGPPGAVLTPSRLAEVYGIAAFAAADDNGPILVPTALWP